MFSVVLSGVRVQADVRIYPVWRTCHQREQIGVHFDRKIADVVRQNSLDAVYLINHCTVKNCYPERIADFKPVEVGKQLCRRQTAMRRNNGVRTLPAHRKT